MHAMISDTPQTGIASDCAHCTNRSACFLAPRIPGERAECRGLVQRRFSVPAGQRLFQRGARLTAIFLVCSGSIKTQRETRDGDLVVNGFYLSGDLVGVDAIADGLYPADAVTTVDSQICRLDYQQLIGHCARHAEIGQWIVAQISRYACRRDDDLAWSTGLQTQKRVLRFFLDLQQRLNRQQSSPAVFTQLPMRKQDIARYLHITPETLSRNLASLRQAGLLELRKDIFALPDPPRARAITRL